MSEPLLNPERLAVHKSLHSLQQAVAAQPEQRFLLELSYDEALRKAGPKAVADSPLLANVGALTMQSSGLEPKQLKVLLGSPHFKQLTVLDLSYNFFHDTGAKALAGFAPLAKVTHLKLTQIGLTSKGLATLAASPHLAGLRSLDVSRNGIKGASGVTALAALAGQLEHWDLWGNDLGDPGVKAIASSPLVRTAKALNLCRVMMKKGGLKALLDSRDIAALEALDVSANHDIGDDGIALIAKAKSLGALRALDLRGTGMSDAAATALAASPVLAQLESLRIAPYGALTDAGVQALRASPHLSAAAKKTLDVEGT